VTTKAGPKRIKHLRYRSSNFIQTLLKNDLVDEFKLKIFPITLGKGKRLFGEGAIPAGYMLVQSQTTPTGVIVATYTRMGEPKTGSFMLETPTKAEHARRAKLATKRPK
jgi:hypothetical protein